MKRNIKSLRRAHAACEIKVARHVLNNNTITSHVRNVKLNKKLRIINKIKKKKCSHRESRRCLCN